MTTHNATMTLLQSARERKILGTFLEPGQATAGSLCIVPVSTIIVICIGCADLVPIDQHVKHTLLPIIHQEVGGQVEESSSTRGYCEDSSVAVVP